VPRDNILSKGNFFFSMSNFPLLTPKNSIGLTVSRLIIVSLKFVCVCVWIPHHIRARINYLPISYKI